MQILPEYHAMLSGIAKTGRKFSQFRPWPNPTIATLCIFGWLERDKPCGDWVQLTEMGRKILDTAVVCTSR